MNALLPDATPDASDRMQGLFGVSPHPRVGPSPLNPGTRRRPRTADLDSLRVDVS